MRCYRCVIKNINLVACIIARVLVLGKGSASHSAELTIVDGLGTRTPSTTCIDAIMKDEIRVSISPQHHGP